MDNQDNTSQQPDTAVDSHSDSESSPDASPGESRLKRIIIPLLGLLIALGIVVGIILVYWRNPDIFEDLEGYGYLGAFLISIILNGTIILPIGNITIIMSLGATLPSPLLVGLAGGFGAAIGELTGYLAGRSGRELIKRNKVYMRVERWVEKWGWLAVFIMSIIPFVFDIVGIIAGALRMPLWRFFVACWAGRTISYVFMAYMADLGLNALPWFS